MNTIASAPDLATLDRESATPLWTQLRDTIRLMILRGDLAVNSQLASEADLCQEYGVSRVVVRESLADLVRSGLIYKIKGKGAFVAPRERDEDFVSTVLGFSDDMELKGRLVLTAVLAQTLRAPTDKEAIALELAPGQLVTSLRRLRRVDGELRVLVDTAVPAEVAPGLSKARLENKSLYDVMRRQYGAHVVRAERWIDAVIPGAAECELLELAAPEALLRIESIGYNTGGRPVEYYNALHRCRSSRLHVQTKG